MSFSGLPERDQLLPSDSAVIVRTHVYNLNRLFNLSTSERAFPASDIGDILSASILDADRRKYNLIHRELEDASLSFSFLQLSNIAELLEKKYAPLTFDHVLNDIAYYGDWNNDDRLQVIVLKKIMFLILRKSGQIELLNYYEIDHDNDRLYYLSLAYKTIAVSGAAFMIDMQLETGGLLSFVELAKRYYSNIDVNIIADQTRSDLPRSLQLLIS